MRANDADNTAGTSQTADPVLSTYIHLEIKGVLRDLAMLKQKLYWGGYKQRMLELDNLTKRLDRLKTQLLNYRYLCSSQHPENGKPLITIARTLIKITEKLEELRDIKASETAGGADSKALKEQLDYNLENLDSLINELGQYNTLTQRQPEAVAEQAF